MLLTTMLVARMIGKESFGKLGIIQSTLMMFSTIGGLGLGATATIYVARYYKVDPERAGRVATLTRFVGYVSGILASIILFVASPWLASRTLNTPALAPLIRIACVSLFFIGINSVQTSILSGLQAFDAAAKSNIITAIGSAACLAVGGWVDGLRGGVWGLATGYAFTAGVTFFFVRHRAHREGISLRARGIWRESSILHTVSLPAFLCNVLVVPTQWICNAILVNSPGGFNDLGLINMSNQWQAMLMFLPMVIAGIVTPSLAKLNGEGNKQTYRKLVLINLFLNIGLGAMACIGIALASPWIVAAYGQGFKGGETVLILTCLSGAFLAANTVAASELTSRGRLWLGVLFCVLLSTALIGFTWWLVPRYGAAGLAGASALAYILHSVWQGIYLWRSLATGRSPGPVLQR